MAIRAVLFDLWGTLVVDDPAVSELRRVLRVESARTELLEMGHVYERSDIEAAFLAAGARHEALHEEHRDLSTQGRTVAYLQELDAGLCERLDDRGWDRLHTAVLTPALQHRPSVMPGAVETLAEVRRLGLATGLISNAGITPGFVLREILDAFGLLRLLDITVFSDEVEMCKPAPAIFAAALEELGVEAAEAAFVGDQPVLDVRGARDAGLWSVQIGPLERDGISPHARVTELAGVLPALRRLGLL
ncbi:MAG: HAD family hydrolase [Chloroflexi bacterium]|nr:HAD family hydrolase [Chloroflexota bacterium]